jgi:hypothetical protein
MRVLAVDAIAPEGLAYLRERNIQVDELAKPSLETLYARIGDYDGLITRSGTSVTAELLDHAPRLRIVGRAGVGVLSIATETSDGRKITAGTVFDGQPRIVRLRDLDIEFAPEGYILVLSYEDRPGMVGRIGSILGRENVNIASMHVGRKSKRGRAIVVLILNENLSPAQVAEVARGVEADVARLVRLP